MTTFPATMTAADALLWNIEQDPVLRSTITAVAVLDRPPEWERLVAKLRRAVIELPRLHQCVAEPPLRAGPPEWVDDPAFDLGYHLRRVRAPEPGTLRAVLDIAAPLSMAGFDRSRPLWELTVVDGLADGGAALVLKLHHSIADGVGSVVLATALFDLAPDAPLRLAPDPAAGQPVARWELLARALTRRGARALRTARVAPFAIARVARRPVAAATDGYALLTSAARMLAPSGASPSPLLDARSLGRRFDVIEVPLAALHDAGARADRTINAAFLAAVVDGAARYHTKHAAPIDQLRVEMPVNIRSEGDDAGGNRFVPTRFTLPTTIVDPVERMQVVGSIAGAWRAEPALAITDVLAGALNALPPSVTTAIFGSLLKGVDLTITNVPGFPFPVYLAGAEVVRMWALAPPSGAGASVALLSHVGTACIGIVADTAAFTDVDSFAACLVDALDDVVGATGSTARQPA